MALSPDPGPGKMAVRSPCAIRLLEGTLRLWYAARDITDTEGTYRLWTTAYIEPPHSA